MLQEVIEGIGEFLRGSDKETSQASMGLSPEVAQFLQARLDQISYGVGNAYQALVKEEEVARADAAKLEQASSVVGVVATQPETYAVPNQAEQTDQAENNGPADEEINEKTARQKIEAAFEEIEENYGQAA